MRTDPAITLAQWFSPGFPVGAFSYSHGLEWVIEQEELTSAADVSEWVEAILGDGTGRTDAIFIGAAYDTERDSELQALDALCLAFCNAAGRIVETSEQGAAFARTLREIGQIELMDCAYPVAVGRAARIFDLPLDMTLRFYLNAFAANLVSAAIRRIPLGQTEGQKVIYDLHPVVVAVSKIALNLSLDDLNSRTFRADIAAMQHEDLYARMFRT